MAAATAGKDRSVGPAGNFTEPRLHNSNYFVTKRRASLFSALSLAAYVSSAPENDALALQTDEFRHSQSRLDC